MPREKQAGHPVLFPSGSQVATSHPETLKPAGSKLPVDCVAELLFSVASVHRAPGVELYTGALNSGRDTQPVCWVCISFRTSGGSANHETLRQHGTKPNPIRSQRHGAAKVVPCVGREKLLGCQVAKLDTKHPVSRWTRIQTQLSWTNRLQPF